MTTGLAGSSPLPIGTTSIPMPLFVGMSPPANKVRLLLSTLRHYYYRYSVIETFQHVDLMFNLQRVIKI